MRTRATGLAAILAALSFAAVLPIPASAHLAGDLEIARRRVTELEERITREESTVQSLGAQLKSLAASVGREQGGLDSVQRELTATKTRIGETKAELQALRERLRARARSVYMRGPLQMVGVLLGSQTIGEFVSRVGYAARLADHDGQLVYKARAAQSKLQDQHARQERLEQEQLSKVTSLRSRQSRITSLFARQMATMAELAQFRGEALHLVSEIEGRIASGEVDGLRRVAGRGMTISYGAWASSFLTALGAPASRDNLVAVVAWEAAEGTMATWNPLATTIAMPEATVYNSHGVKNYRSKEQGIEASIMTLRRPGHGYEAIIASLRSGAEAMETGRAINRSDWCRGCAGGTYVIGFIPAVEQYYDRYA
ncbi:MAG: coiled-coil domain-containing protein [Actinomycetota bacterium]